MGENGLFNKARIAKQEYQNAQDYETEQIEKYTNQISSIASNRNETGNYSFDEKAIDTWVDGSTIYRKVFTGTTSNSYTSGKSDTEVGTLNAKAIIQTYGYLLRSSDNTIFNIPYCQSNTATVSSVQQVATSPYGISTWHRNGKLNIRCTDASGTFGGCTYYLVVEYTKNS